MFQFKALLRPLAPNDWGVGLAVGTVRHPAVNPGPNQFGNHYAHVPLSMSFDDDRVVLHANVGWLHDRRSDRDGATWGVGAGIYLAERWLDIVEVFGDDRQHPFWQLGARCSVVPGQVQVGATMGEQLSGQSLDVFRPQADARSLLLKRRPVDASARHRALACSAVAASLVDDIAHRVEHAVATVSGEHQRALIDHLDEAGRFTLVRHRRVAVRVISFLALGVSIATLVAHLVIG